MEEFFAGWMGGCAGLLVGHPLDTVKVRQQAMTHNGSASMLNVVRTTLAHEGVRGFYKGMAFPLVTASAQNSVLFGVFNNTKQWWSTRKYGADDRASYAEVFLIGSFAGVVQGIIPTCTMELVKIKLQMQTGAGGVSEFRGPIDTLRKIYTHHGVPGCFQGLNATVIRELPALGIYMATYEYLRDYILGEGGQRGQAVAGKDRWGDAVPEEVDEHKGGQSEVAAELLAGGAAGVASWVGNIPMDVLKSRLQADNLSHRQYTGYIDCVRKSYRADGGRVFWRGLPATCIRAFPVNAVTFATVEATKRVFKLLHGDKPSRD